MAATASGPTTAATGHELFKTDGTAAGTKLLADINPNGDSSPYGITEGYHINFGRLGNNVLFRADDGPRGAEPWVYDNGATSWTAEPAGGSATRAPHVAMTDPVIGKIATATHSDLYVGGVVVLIVGLQDATPLSRVWCTGNSLPHVGAQRCCSQGARTQADWAIRRGSATPRATAKTRRSWQRISVAAH